MCQCRYGHINDEEGRCIRVYVCVCVCVVVVVDVCMLNLRVVSNVLLAFECFISLFAVAGRD